MIDRVGPRLTLGCGLVLQAIGFGLLPLVREPWQAFVLLAVEGVGAAGFWPSQSTLISRLTPAARRHAAFAQQRVTMNLGVGLGGIVGGLIAQRLEPEHVHDPLRARRADIPRLRRRPVVRPRPRRVRRRGRRRLRPTAPCCATRRSSGSGAINFLFVAAGYSLLSLFPQFARDQSGITERQIGVIFAVNTAAIVLAQLPISHWIEGRRRMRALALMPLIWAVAG